MHRLFLILLPLVFLFGCSKEEDILNVIQYGSGSAVLQPSGWTFWTPYKNSGSTMIHPYQFDNGPDYFVEGLARFVHNKKIGFFDTAGTIIIQPEYDFASPFCNHKGCSQVSGEEHATFSGGLWGRIDHGGSIVISVTQKRDSLPTVQGENCAI
jgi:hypothetical protein